MPRRQSLILLWITALAAACGGTSAQPVAEPTPTAPIEKPPTPLPPVVLFIPGEVMSFTMSFRNIEGGEAVLAVGQPGSIDGKQVIIVRSEAKSTGVVKLIKDVRDDIKTLIDVARGAPVEYEADMIFGNKHLVLSSQFKGRKVYVQYQRTRRDKPPPKRKRIRRRTFTMPTGEITYEPHTALGAMRAWEPQPGEKVYFYGLSGNRMWRVELRFTTHETLRTAMGLYPAVRIDGVATRLTKRLKTDKKRKPRSFTIWFSDDINRIPLRIIGRTEYGEVRIEMTSYYRPDRRSGPISLR